MPTTKPKQPTDEPTATPTNPPIAPPTDDQLAARQSLLDSGIITLTDDNAIIWRPGHLAHVANVYQGNQFVAWRDYHNDLVVAQRWSNDEWTQAFADVNGEG